MMNIDELLNQLWLQYTSLNPQAERIQALLQARGECVINDHIALRTFGLEECNIDKLAAPFLACGYEEKGHYHFKEKKLKARHYELEGRPRVFISELLVEEFSESLQQGVKQLTSQLPAGLVGTAALLTSGASWKSVSKMLYEQWLTESEYAAWLSVFGFCANHFTVSVNHLNSFPDLKSLDAFLLAEGFVLNTAGGQIKGGREDLLAQSSTMASQIKMSFSDGDAVIPSCYYEFAERFYGTDGKLFNGFVTQSADKIFESTDRPVRSG